MKKLIVILLISVFGQILGQTKTPLYLDSFDKNEIPSIPIKILVGSSIDEILQNIYEYRLKTFEIDSINCTYRIGKQNIEGLWFNTHFSSKYENYEICEQFGSDIYNSRFDFNQNVYYNYNELNELVSVNNEYTLKYNNKLYNFSTETRIDYSVSGKKIVMSKAFLFDEFEAGKWQIYNNKGKLINELNFDKKFKLTFIDVFNILKDFFYLLDIDNESITLERSFNEEDAYWICKMQTDYYFKAIIINDKTGEILYENNTNILKQYLFRDYENKLIEVFLSDFYN